MTESLYTREFEKISKGDLVSGDGVRYNVFKKNLTPDFTKVWRDIFAGYAGLAIIGAILYLASRTVTSILLIPTGLIASVLIGYFLAYIQLFFHEASHHNIAKEKERNDRLANIFIGIFVGQDIKSYRVTHWEHHRYLGTTMDTEHSYFDALNIQFIVESLTGIRVAKVLFDRQKHTSKKTEQKHSTFGPMLVAGLLFHFFMITIPLIFGFWIFSVCWILGVIVFFPFFGAVRQVLEHRNSESEGNLNFYQQDHGAHNRIFDDGPVSNTLGGAGFNRHLLHHWEPQISYTRLKDLEKYLMNTTLKEAILQSRTTYWKIFFKLIRQH